MYVRDLETVLRPEPPELAQRFTLSYEPGRGRFADSDAALVQLASGQQFMLVHHRDDPTGDRAVGRRDLAAAG